MSPAPGGLDLRTLVHTRRQGAIPWSSEQFGFLAAANALGVVLVVTGWWVVSGSGQASDQVSWMNLAILGLVIALAADVWFLSQCRRVVRLARVTTFASPPRTARRSSSELAPDRLVSAIGMTWFHRPDCDLVMAKAVEAATRDEWARLGVSECQVCRP
jgi:hypothetical protein